MGEGGYMQNNKEKKNLIEFKMFLSFVFYEFEIKKNSKKKGIIVAILLLLIKIIYWLYENGYFQFE